VKAIIHERYGSSDLLRLMDVDPPEVEDDQVLVRVRAASVNSGVWRQMRGSPFLIRLGEGLRKPKTRAFGADASGVVEAVGADVTHLKVGDEVFGVRTGAFGEYVAGRTFVPKPTNLTFEQAAAVPIAGCTALQAVRDHAVVQAGQRILVTGAGGGVGTFTVQIAKAFGAHVTAVSRTENLEMLRSIGADEVIDYTAEDFTRSGQRYDRILDVSGNRAIRDIRRVLAPGGVVVIVGGPKGQIAPVARLGGGAIRRRLFRQPLVVFIAHVDRDELLALKELAESGKVTPFIDRSYPLAEAPAALAYLETTRAQGKVVITI